MVYGKPASGDPWPQINLAKVILEGAPVAAASAVPVGLNEHVAKAGPPTPAVLGAAAASALPQGCVPDIDRTNLEHRRIQFAGTHRAPIESRRILCGHQTRPSFRTAS
jgi:hypothetical protein